VLVADGTTTGWFDAARDGGFVRRAEESYLPSSGDAFVPPQIVRQLALRRGDLIEATTGRDQRGRLAVAEVTRVNGGEPTSGLRRPDFSSLIASYPERKLTLETGQSPNRLRAARAHRRAGSCRKDDAAAGDHGRRRDQSSRGNAARAARG
jgi:transcription termination factor Rho